MSSPATAWYLYCLAPEPVVPETAGLRAWTRGAITAVVAEVPLDEFRGPEAEARLQDLAWVGPRACRHEAVVEEVMRLAPVLPARFATLFRSGESLDRFLEAHAPALAAFFAGLDGQREWGVKGLLARAEPPPAGLETSSGARYFEQRRAEIESRNRRRLWLRETCEKAAAELRALAGDFRERKVIGPPDTEAEPVFNWAFLLRPAAEEEFRRAVDRLNRDDAALRFVLSGPWPPYSFAPAL